MLEDWVKQREKPLRAVTFRRGWSSKARPVLMRYKDGHEYVVKGQQAGRQIVNDRIIAHLGLTINAPVGEPRVIEVPAELVEIERNLSHIFPGTAHGTRFIPDCFDSWELIATSELENRPRLTRLAILYSWVLANDWQFLFKKNPPRLIYSIDHGHFFPGGPEWSEQQLLEAPHVELAPCFHEIYYWASERLANVSL